jgi:3-hydroxybutyryl-CoA dehydrogenase
VLLWARSGESACRARAGIERSCSRLPDVDPERIRVVTELEELAPATFLVEAIVEDAVCKAELLRRLGEIAAPDAIVATTTSSLCIADLAIASGRPDRFVGLHVFNPVVKMKLVELVFGPEAGAEARDRAAALCAALGKEAVVVPDVPGFVVNRLLFPYLFSAVRLMEETGLEPAAVDACMQMGAGMPMGPLALLDFVGLDVSVAIGDAIGADVPDSLRRLVAEGALGRKTGHGVHPAQQPAAA